MKNHCRTIIALFPVVPFFSRTATYYETRRLARIAILVVAACPQSPFKSKTTTMQEKLLSSLIHQRDLTSILGFSVAGSNQPNWLNGSSQVGGLLVVRPLHFLAQSLKPHSPIYTENDLEKFEKALAKNFLAFLLALGFNSHMKSKHIKYSQVLVVEMRLQVMEDTCKGYLEHQGRLKAQRVRERGTMTEKKERGQMERTEKGRMKFGHFLTFPSKVCKFCVISHQMKQRIESLETPFPFSAILELNELAVRRDQKLSRDRGKEFVIRLSRNDVLFVSQKSICLFCLLSSS